EDLYYRLNVLPLIVPPLRERDGDVSILVEHFLEHFSRSHGEKLKRISSKALEALQRYEWPGNIRELRNMVERLMIMSTGQEIQLEDLPQTILNASGGAKSAGVAAGGSGGGPLNPLEFGDNYKDAKDAFERAFLKAQLERNQWNVSKTAELIRLERSNLHKKIKQYKIEMD
ncbi:MAG TPA: helix-turn-helix domain-containing protein, partial [bacterium]